MNKWWRQKNRKLILEFGFLVSEHLAASSCSWISRTSLGQPLSIALPKVGTKLKTWQTKYSNFSLLDDFEAEPPPPRIQSVNISLSLHQSTSEPQMFGTRKHCCKLMNSRQFVGCIRKLQVAQPNRVCLPRTLPSCVEHRFIRFGSLCVIDEPYVKVRYLNKACYKNNHYIYKHLCDFMKPY
jgi:hypothetical protein